MKRETSKPAPKPDNYERKPATPGWDYGLPERKRVFLLHYMKTGNKSAAAREAGIAKKSACRTGIAWLQSVSVANAWAMLNGADPPYPESLPKIGKAARDVDRPPAQDVTDSAPADFKTFAGKRLLMEARQTPLDVMVNTMNSAWEAAEALMAEDHRGIKVDTEESMSGKRLACQIAKDAAPYMHSRLTAVEAKVTGNDLGAMSTKELEKELQDAQKTIDRLVGINDPTKVAVGAGLYEDGDDGGDLGDDIPPVH